MLSQSTIEECNNKCQETGWVKTFEHRYEEQNEDAEPNEEDDYEEDPNEQFNKEEEEEEPNGDEQYDEQPNEY
ncbi:hypothetical protein B9Z55_018250 [Caenorhabditis nigoni]|uniref:Uncharacterized protein n=1 Tax=Caenorhabditis nigoni TaxID=1611254 RepID=A0A2G5TDT9_9PELO|nr:hypothetical protein B9Z55_018250 [Caenorhabditis nigoni]